MQIDKLVSKRQEQLTLPPVLYEATADLEESERKKVKFLSCV